MKKQPGLANVSVQLDERLVARAKDLVIFHEEGGTSEAYLKEFRRGRAAGNQLEKITGKTSRGAA